MLLMCLQYCQHIYNLNREGRTLDKYLSKRALFEFAATYGELEDVFAMHFARYSLSRTKFNALIHLYMTGDRGLTQSELSKKMLVSRANITSLIERLEKEDLVVRSNDPSDKRVFRVCLTDKAVMLMNFFLPIHNDYVHKVMSALDGEEREIFITLLEKLRKGMETV